MMFLFEFFVKTVSFVLKKILKSGGETWPGEIILRFFPNISNKLDQLFIEKIYILGTNGKTSTSKLLVEVLKKNKLAVITNSTGANQLNGIVSSILSKKSFFKNNGYIGVFEVDEFHFTKIAKYFKPTKIILLNLLRDQLDRYGEVQKILDSWREVIADNPQVKVIANSYDPGLYFLLKDFSRDHLHFYGIPESLLKKESNVFGDYLYCPSCGKKIDYHGLYVSHLGAWECTYCRISPPVDAGFDYKILEKYSHLPSYHLINSQAVFNLSRIMNLPDSIFFEALDKWQPAFGRGEKISKNGCDYFFYLGKNPSSWTVALNYLIQSSRNDNLLQKPVFIFGLNNQNPDGHDTSWIWDVEINNDSRSVLGTNLVYVYGDRAYDMAIRLKNEEVEVKEVFVSDNKLLSNSYDKSTRLTMAIHKIQSKKVYILANYSALLEIRKKITGRAIL